MGESERQRERERERDLVRVRMWEIGEGMCSLTACDLKMNVSLPLFVARISAVVAEIMVRNPM